MKIAIAGTGYVGLSNAVLLAQHNEVKAVDIVSERVKLLNAGKSPIVDKELEKFLAEGNLNFQATTDAKQAYREADFVVVATPTNYDSKRNSFDTSSVENVIELVLSLLLKFRYGSLCYEHADPPLLEYDCFIHQQIDSFQRSGGINLIINGKFRDGRYLALFRESFC